jgi:hypothetical protein
MADGFCRRAGSPGSTAGRMPAATSVAVRQGGRLQRPGQRQFGVDGRGIVEFDFCMPADVFTVQEEIVSPKSERHHVVILGAGASRAAFQFGDQNGQRLPIMKDFVDVIGLTELLATNGINPPFDNFEGIYSDIVKDTTKAALQNEIEKRVYDYFAALKLPDAPTLYDHLILSLRPKDVIATFNWDPFLWNAAARNRHFSEPPNLLFLHGNVAIGHCPACERVFCRSYNCPQCGRNLVASPLLYPVKQKDYQSDPAIAGHWRSLASELKSAWTITSFGYGAPNTDVEAIKLLKNARGDSEKRFLEETEIIDIRPKDYLIATWNPFIHSHHFGIHESFYESTIAKHPRRSCEVFWERNAGARFVEGGVDFPKNMDFEALYNWLEPRIAAEQTLTH